jgi:hypothetical protein
MKKAYTVELYKLDRRMKDGMKLVYKTDYEDVTLDQMERMYPVRPKYVRKIHETYVTKRNMMSGAEFQERYDTPYFCSPASESYWSM